jgi:CheY-like chemotaxis protein
LLDATSAERWCVRGDLRFATIVAVLVPAKSRLERGAACVLLQYSATMKALQILAVEDEKAVAQILAVVLGGPMSKVTRAADGWEALIKIAAAPQPFDVIITDHRMPRMGGLELVRKLRTRNFEGKILVLSAHLSDEDIRAYEELHVDMMMSKPFDFEEIQSAVAILTKGASVAVAA